MATYSRSAQPIAVDSGSSAISTDGSAQAYSFKDKKNEFEFWAGSSLGLPSALGASHDRSFPILIGLRYGRILLSSRVAALEYTLDVVPVAVVSEPKDASTGLSGSPGGRLHVYGAGIVPVGFKLILRPDKRVKPYVAVSSGPFYFTRQVPVVNSAQFNFFSAADVGLQIFASPRRAISIGYKIGHLSNAGAGHLNPGFNSSSIYFGFSVFK
ncbi:MAG: acyloxyacyl hydrolase [Blastocatellia bacterium]